LILSVTINRKFFLSLTATTNTAGESIQKYTRFFVEKAGVEDRRAKITGFSDWDRYCFMWTFLGSSNEAASELEDVLGERNLVGLAKFPLLLLFFYIVWKKGERFPISKTRLYMSILQFVLNHSHDEYTPPQYAEVSFFREILSEIGKISWDCLLKDDDVFEYNQLSDSVRCHESVFIDLLQATEYSETSRPVGMVSFIHKSIQEFLAAWYITYRCLPKGGNLGEIGLKMEECLALENVFPFVCGLSDDGALMALSHLKYVRISDPSLDLSKAIPGVESETRRSTE